MKRFLAVALVLVLLAPVSAFAARGFGATVGTASTDVIVTGDLASSQTRSFCLWFNTRVVDASVSARLLAQETVGGANISDISQNTTANLRFVYGAVTDGSWNIAEPSTGSWHHLCITRNGSSSTNDPIFYLDGTTPALTEVVGGAGAVDSGTTPYRIGNTDDGDRVFDGSIAEVAGWTSELSAGNVASLYNSGSGARADSIGVAPQFYFTLCGNASPEPEEMGGTAGTVTGTAVTSHPFSNCSAAASNHGMLTVGVGN